jgi:hypothetical protein
MAIIGPERYRTKLISMPDKKKEQDKSVEIEAGGLSGRRGMSLGNPRPRHSPTVSPVSTAVLTCGGVPVVEEAETPGGIMFGVRAETMIAGVPLSQWPTDELMALPWHMVTHLTDEEKRGILDRAGRAEAIDLVDQKINRGPFTKGY